MSKKKGVVDKICGQKTIFTARFARGAEKDRVLKANKQEAVLCVLRAFAVKSSLIKWVSKKVITFIIITVCFNSIFPNLY
jgi:hypothetical protein